MKKVSCRKAKQEWALNSEPGQNELLALKSAPALTFSPENHAFSPEVGIKASSSEGFPPVMQVSFSPEGKHSCHCPQTLTPGREQASRGCV